MKIGVKFCGGCNPQINRSRIYKELQRQFPGSCGLIQDGPNGLWDVGILLCGCPVACADADEVRRKAHQWIVVGGTMVDYYPVDESKIVESIIQKCQKTE
ncbi:MAG: hypothetical protein ACM3UW_07140 [Bacillota bacterium]